MKSVQFALIEERADARKAQTHHLFQNKDVFYASQAEHDRLAALPSEDTMAHFDDPVWEARFQITSDATGVLHDALKTDNICTELEDKICQEYEAAGRPKSRKKWLKERLLLEYRWLKSRPRWTDDEGEWPSYLGRQMLYIGQVAVPQNEIAEAHCLGGRMVYLFAGWSDSHVEYNIVSQCVGQQTAEQHYQAEGMIGLYLKSPKDLKTLQQCVMKGDQYVHEFLLGQPGLKLEALKLLSAKGANKTIREEALRRVKGSTV